MHPNLATREKPELPKHLELFRILYNKLDPYPVGPKYLGNHIFEKHNMSSDEIEFVKDHRNDLTVVQMCYVLAKTFGIFIRAEAVSQYYSKGKDSKLWQVNRDEYLKGFEKRNGLSKGGKKGAIDPGLFWKPFIEWCITEALYEFYQVARVLGYCPGSVRKFANEYGYREYVMVRAKQPDLTGKVDRVERSGEQGPLDLFSKQEMDEWRNKGIAIANEVTHIPERHEMKLPRDVKDYDLEMKTGVDLRHLKDIELQRESEKKEEVYGSYIRQALRDGHKVTITIEPK